MPKGKRLIPLPEDLVDELRGIAEEAGIPISELIDNTLSIVTRLIGARTDITSAIIEAAIAVELERIGAMLIPLQALLEAVESIDENRLGKILRLVEDFAHTVTVIIREREVYTSKTPAPILSALLPGAVIHETRRGNGGRIVAALPTGIGEKAAALVGSIVRGVVKGLGYKPVSERFEAGVVTVEYVEEGSS